MRKWLTPVAGVVFGVSGLANGESLISAPWSTAGWVEDQSALFPAPFTGQPGLFLSTGKEIDDPRIKSVTILEGIVGTSLKVDGRSFDAGGAHEGSAAWMGFSGSSGDVLTVRWDFVTSEGSALYAGLTEAQLLATGLKYVNDYAFAAMAHAGAGTEVWRLADDFTSGMADIDVTSEYRFLAHTGVRTFTYVLPADGAYTLYLGVLDGADDLHPVLNSWGESALWVESVELRPATDAAPVPTPGAAVAGAVLLGGMACRRATRRPGGHV